MITLTYLQGWNNALYQFRRRQRPQNVQTMLGHSSIVLTADTYTSVLPDLAHHAAEATARLVLTSAARTSRNIRNGHHTRHKRPAKTTVTPHHPTPAIHTVIRY